eukprot:Gregarina_sp_Poly_1__1078@NODE_1264_length_4570_cov_95_245614_g859_i0_p2_GENE_NODE_1264_length_4570_cov_95_245614_g859_i0NODE_1264_length_4570_cov_95_245614_g859_i0_p2_ORF_typecomplete_len340_score42_68UvsW/PF11637_8/5_4e02UvsW/PF11637_8/0_38_NODE_1264_length_4570_cov_95_245614_g859_i023123331
MSLGFTMGRFKQQVGIFFCVGAASLETSSSLGHIRMEIGVQIMGEYKQVKWAADVIPRESSDYEKKNTYYRERIKQRVLKGNPVGYTQCRQNIHKILHDADVYCEVQDNKIRAAKCMLPPEWRERFGYVPIIPIPRALEICAVEVDEYPLWAHFRINFWLRYDHDIDIAPLIRSHSVEETISGTMMLSQSVCSEGKSDFRGLCYNANNAIQLKKSEEILPFTYHSWYRRHNKSLRLYSWFSRAVQKSQLLVQALLRPAELRRPQDILEELATEELQNENARFEITFLDLDELRVKLLQLKQSNLSHHPLIQALNELIGFYKIRKREIEFSDTDSLAAND